jgi:hypothetical protein
MLWLLACGTVEPDTQPVLESAVDEEDTPPKDLPPCPQEMVPVTRDGVIAFCIDRYEVHAEGKRGDANQVLEDAVRPTAIAQSTKGVVPTIDVSWGQAKAICENSGKRLPTSSEWEDAADGTVGEGGLLYVYGDTFDPEACACLDAEAEPIFFYPQESGSLPGCESPFGTFDQSGNVFEWTDPQQTFDHSAWFELNPSLTQTGDALLATDDVAQLRLDLPGVDPNSLRLSDGLLTVDAGDGWNWGDGPPGGVLIANEALLAVEAIVVSEVPGPARIRVRTQDANAPLADKRGGSYYSGTDWSCRNHQQYLGHLHDFSGTIGFRCALDPR